MPFFFACLFVCFVFCCLFLTIKFLTDCSNYYIGANSHTPPTPPKTLLPLCHHCHPFYFDLPTTVVLHNYFHVFLTQIFFFFAKLSSLEYTVVIVVIAVVVVRSVVVVAILHCLVSVFFYFVLAFFLFLCLNLSDFLGFSVTFSLLLAVSLHLLLLLIRLVTP